MVLGVDAARLAARDMVDAIRQRKLCWDGQKAVYPVPAEHQQAIAQVKVVFCLGSGGARFSGFDMAIEGGCVRLDPMVVEAIDLVPEDKLENIFLGGHVWDSITFSPNCPSWLSAMERRA